MSPADELYAAARTLRTLAQAATPGQWSVDHEFPDIVISTEATWKGRPAIVASDLEGGDPAWIALVHPGLAGPLAALLAALGDLATTHPDLSRPHVDGEPCDDHACRIVARARDVARVLNGTEEETSA